MATAAPPRVNRFGMALTDAALEGSVSKVRIPFSPSSTLFDVNDDQIRGKHRCTLMLF